MMKQHKPGDEQQDEDDSVARNYGSAMIPLGEDFEPGEDDVLVGRGKMCRNWQGNARFRDLVASRLDEYSAASSKLEKSAIVTSILYQIRTKSPKGGFIKKDPLTGHWYEVGDFVARERVTQCFRDALHGKYRSSNSSKKKRRKEELRRAKETPPLKKLKKAPQQRLETTGEPDTSAPPPLSGLHTMMLPSSLPTSLPHPLAQLETRSMLFDQPLNSTLNTGLTANSVSSSLMPSLAAQQGAPSPGTLMQEQSLEQQIMALQRMNQPVPNTLLNLRDDSSTAIQQHGTQPQDSYPSGWFRVGSGETVLNSLMNNLSASNTANLATPQPALSTLTNQTFIPSPVQSQTGSVAQAAANAALTNPTPTMVFSGYTEDDNPFEPVPIAENISRRHRANRDSESQS